MLRRLAGRTHRVHTAVAVCSAEAASSRQGATTSESRFVAMSDDAIDWYVATGEPLDKAGAYGLQGIGGVFVGVGRRERDRRARASRSTSCVRLLGAPPG